MANHNKRRLVSLALLVAVFLMLFSLGACSLTQKDVSQNLSQDDQVDGNTSGVETNETSLTDSR